MVTKSMIFLAADYLSVLQLYHKCILCSFPFETSQGMHYSLQSVKYREEVLVRSILFLLLYTSKVNKLLPLI